MLPSVHMVTGAAIGSWSRTISPARRWWLLVPAFASHFLLDFIPHSDTHALFGAPGGITRAEAIGTLADVLLGVALVLWLTAAKPWRRTARWTAFAAVVIDLVDNVPPWGPHFQTWAGTAWLSAFHHGFQHNLPRAQWPLGMAIQVVFLAAALWLTRRR